MVFLHNLPHYLLGFAIGLVVGGYGWGKYKARVYAEIVKEYNAMKAKLP